MTSRIGYAFYYWFKAIIKPGEVLDAFKSHPNKLQVSLWLLFFFAILYSITAIILYFFKVPPVIESWIPIDKDKYYLYQALWTIPWGLATAMMLAGIAHVMAVLGRRDVSPFTFEDSLVIIAIAWVIPSFVLMWVPETLVVPFFRGAPWPPWIDLLRLSILAPIWHIVLVVIGMRKTHQVSWVRGVVIGVVFVSVSFGMFLPIMR
jgi:hypothetical protein